jgi:hypothetical protein
MLAEVTMQEYTLDFELSGPNVPVERILSFLNQASGVESWKVGDAITQKRHATTSGVRIVIASRVDKKTAEESLERFFGDHAYFLGRLSGLRSAGDEQFVRCIMCVDSDNASYLELSEAALLGLSSSKTTFLVAAWPCDK